MAALGVDTRPALDLWRFIKQAGAIATIGAVIGAGAVVGAIYIPGTIGGGGGSVAPPGTGNVFVSSDGSDGGVLCARGNTPNVFPSDTTKVCRSLGKAYSIAEPGDLVLIASGTYPAQTIVKGAHVQTGPAITFQCGIEHECIMGNMTLGQNNGQFSGDSPSYLTFDGVDFKGSVGSNFNDNAHASPSHVTFQNLHVWCITSCGSGIFLTSMSDILIDNVEIGPICCGGGDVGADGMELGVSRNGAPNPTNVHINHTYIHDVYDSCTLVPDPVLLAYGTCSGSGFTDGCTSCDHVDGIQVYGGDTFLMENSRMYNVGGSGTVGQGLFMQGANGGTFSNVTVVNNMFGTTPNNDVSMSGPGDGTWTGYLHVYYNTIDKNLRLYGFGTSTIFAPGTEIIVAGNIIQFLGSSNSNGCDLILSDDSVFTPTYSHNLNGNQACGATNTVGTGTFVSTDPATIDLHLLGAQFAIDGGEAVYCPAEDIDGQARPIGLACDIGADEAD